MDIVIQVQMRGVVDNERYVCVCVCVSRVIVEWSKVKGVKGSNDGIVAWVASHRRARGSRFSLFFGWMIGWMIPLRSVHFRKANALSESRDLTCPASFWATVEDDGSPVLTFHQYHCHWGKLPAIAGKRDERCDRSRHFATIYQIFMRKKKEVEEKTRKL